MKTKPTRPAHQRRTPNRPPQTHRADPLQGAAVERRLYTDFLALAFYPGMRPAAPRAEIPAA